jgi:hypothetical protein
MDAKTRGDSGTKGTMKMAFQSSVPVHPKKQARKYPDIMDMREATGV